MVELSREQLAFACGSTRWVDAMLASRPFVDRAAVHAAATRAFAALSREDLLEAMSHHPRIGAAPTNATEAHEQAGAVSADDQLKAELADGNRAYEARFGHIYLVCASGKTGPELLALLQARLRNTPEAELAIAAAEQEKITHLRLDQIMETA